MDVVEDVAANFGLGCDGTRELQPTLARVHAGQVQAPEEGRGIAQIEHEATPMRSKQTVMDGECRGGIIAVEMVESEVPGIVDGEEAGLRPVGLARLVLGDPLLVPALHLQHVCHGMDGPAIHGIAADGLAPQPPRRHRLPRGQTRACPGRNRCPFRLAQALPAPAPGAGARLPARP